MLKNVKICEAYAQQSAFFFMYLHDACWQAVNKFQEEMMYALCMKGKENGLVAICQTQFYLEA